MRERKQISLAFGKVLKELRVAAGLTQEQLGFEAGLERIYVSLLERGQRSPSLVVVLDLAKALGMGANDIVAKVEQRLSSGKRTR
jgi:transcriptional regulator with XRE-family HTH domain